MEYMQELAYIAVILLTGTLASAFAYGIKTSDIFILLLVGMLLSNFGVLGFDHDFIVILSTFALIFVVFNSSLVFNIKDVKKYLFSAFKLTLIYFVLCTTLLTIGMIYVFNLDFTMHTVLLGVLFSILCYGTDPTAVLSLFKGFKNKYIEIVEIESVINTPFTLIPSFLILNALDKAGTYPTNLFMPVLSFFQLIIVGLIIALIGGWIITTILKRIYFGELTHLAVLTSAIIIYVGTEYLGGSGVIAVAVYGIIFGNSHIAHFIEIERFESIFTNSIKILTFMLLGTIILIKPEYILKGTVLFFTYICIRFVSALLTFRKDKITAKEALFIAINVPKGVDIALVLLLTLSLHSGIENIEIVINLTMLTVLYSIVLSSIGAPFTHYLLTEDKKKNL